MHKFLSQVWMIPETPLCEQGTVTIYLVGILCGRDRCHRNLFPNTEICFSFPVVYSVNGGSEYRFYLPGFMQWQAHH